MGGGVCGRGCLIVVGRRGGVVVRCYLDDDGAGGGAGEALAVGDDIGDGVGCGALRQSGAFYQSQFLPDNTVSMFGFDFR